MKFPNLFPHVCAFLLLSVIDISAQAKSLASFPVAIHNSYINYSIAKEDSKHQIFFEALKAADLDCLLNEDAPYTIFVPSDAAFKKIAKVKMGALLNSEDKMQLKSLLKYHIINGKLSASKILKSLCRGGGKTTLTTMQGTKIRVSFKGTDILLIDNTGNTAKITVADLESSSGIVHQIDEVIMPSRI